MQLSQMGVVHELYINYKTKISEDAANIPLSGVGVLYIHVMGLNIWFGSPLHHVSTDLAIS